MTLFSGLADKAKKQNDNVRTDPFSVDLPTHPLTSLKNYVERCNGLLKSFNLYSYDWEDCLYGETQSNDQKEHFVVPANDIVPRGLEILEQCYKDGQDVVVSSTVDVTNPPGEYEQLQMPLIDFSVPSDLLSFRNVLNDDTFCVAFFKATGLLLEDFDIYSSGRSYHGYYRGLINKKAWEKYMLSLLTLPGIPGADYVPDCRWIGHRLLMGDGALRLTATHTHYLHQPKLVSPVACSGAPADPEIVF